MSRNAVKHGIMSPHPVIIEGMETEEEWEAFRQAIVESLEPQGAFEVDLAESIALTRWRLKRVMRLETAVVNRQVQLASDELLMADAYLSGVPVDEIPDPSPVRVRARQEERLVPRGDDLTMTTYYETKLHRLWVQTLHELQALQSRRRGEPAPLVRLGVSGPPA